MWSRILMKAKFVRSTTFSPYARMSICTARNARGHLRYLIELALS